MMCVTPTGLLMDLPGRERMFLISGGGLLHGCVISGCRYRLSEVQTVFEGIQMKRRGNNSE